MTVFQALREGEKKLLQSGVPDSRLDAELLLAHVLNKQRMVMLLNGREELSPADSSVYGTLLGRRMAREPLQYIVSCQQFMGLDLYVDENVLIPRPETELLLEKALHWLEQKSLQDPDVLDLCTGSGALAVGIAHFLPRARVSASDLSLKALKVAKKNAKTHHAPVAFFQGDFLSAVSGMRFDLIVCNPPYIITKECDALQIEVQREPRMALDGGDDGLFFYRRLAEDALQFLNPGGAVFLEVGHNQAEAVKKLFSAFFKKICVFDDLCRVPRIVAAE